MTIHPQALPLDQVQVLAGFWHDRMTVNREQTLPAVYDKLKSTGRLACWRRDVADEDLHRHIFWDSDTAKWIEAAGYALVGRRDEALERQIDEVVGWMVDAQGDDGYLNSYFLMARPEGRWTNLRDNHELYCAGHLMEAAIAYHQATGKRTLLDALTRYADYIGATFGTGPGQKRGYCGHPEIELALVRLAEATGASRYLDLASYFVDERGRTPNYYDLEAEARGENPRDFWARTYRYCQAHQPVRDQTVATGHSVRAAYLYSAMVDLARRTRDDGLADACRALWEDLTTRQMYLIGGMGPSDTHEGFTFAYDLPNETAYGETCSAIALAYFAQRMFELDGKGATIDVLERAFYNNIIAGVSAEGRHFFQCNPLTAYPYYSPYVRWNGILADRHYRRVDWIDCACCPTNLVRLVASVNGYLYAATADTVYVNLFASSRARLRVGGAAVTLEQLTDYPWEGAVHLEVRASDPVAFTLAVRVPRLQADGQRRGGRRRPGRRLRPADPQVDARRRDRPRPGYAHRAHACASRDPAGCRTDRAPARPGRVRRRGDRQRPAPGQPGAAGLGASDRRPRPGAVGRVGGAHRRGPAHRTDGLARRHLSTRVAAQDRGPDSAAQGDPVRVLGEPRAGRDARLAA